MKKTFNLVVCQIPLCIIYNGLVIVVVIDDGIMQRVGMGASLQTLKTLPKKWVLGLGNLTSI
jgi:hypothetical protein